MAQSHGRGLPHIAWISLDPREATLCCYPGYVAKLLEDASQRGQEFVHLGEQFHGARVYFRGPNGMPFQRTKAGVRDVRRVQLTGTGTTETVRFQITGSFPEHRIQDVYTPGAQERSVIVSPENALIPLASPAASGAQYTSVSVLNPQTELAAPINTAMQVAEDLGRRVAGWVTELTETPLKGLKGGCFGEECVKPVREKRADQRERLMQELFRLHDLNGNGVLEEEELVKLNEKIAMLHYGKDIDKQAVKSKYQDLFRTQFNARGQPVPYETFRTYMSHVLQTMDPDDQAAHVMILEQFIAEAQSGRDAFLFNSFSSTSDAPFLPMPPPAQARTTSQNKWIIKGC